MKDDDEDQEDAIKIEEENYAPLSPNNLKEQYKRKRQESKTNMKG
jgi:hypothetical protein